MRIKLPVRLITMYRKYDVMKVVLSDRMKRIKISGSRIQGSLINTMTPE
jgi:hypothetical protein